MNQETLEEVAERYSNQITENNEFHKLYVAFKEGAKWQQEQIGKSEFLQRLRGTLSDAEARRLLKESQALHLLQSDVIKSVCNRANNFENNRCINCGAKAGHKC